VAAVDEAAEALRIKPGQTLADALALEPRLAMADADPEGDLAALEALADWCVRFSPAVAIDPPDGLILDVSGAGGLWGGEAALIDDLVARLALADIPARAAIAPTIGAAWAFARWGADRTVAGEGENRALLEPLPVEALRLEPAAMEDLIKLGLDTVGQVLAAPRGALSSRFGPATRLRLDQALGLVEEARSWRRPPTPFQTRLAFFEPIAAPEDLERVMSDAVTALCAQLDAATRGAQRFELYFHRVDGRTLTATVGTALPSRDAPRLIKLFRPRIEAVDPGFGIEAVTLLADRTAPLADRQNGLIEARDPDAAGDGPEALVDRLVNRLGADRVWRPRPVERWLPEKAVERAPPLAPPRPDAPPAWPAGRPRPIRLFRKPEPLERVIAPVPDDPPVQFQWRGRLHRVRRAEGPERLAQEWWRTARGPEERYDTRRVRDYYRVEDADGRRFWIFRLGLYDPAEPPRWWLHGLFA
jgi:protein ImuB